MEHKAMKFQASWRGHCQRLTDDQWGFAGHFQERHLSLGMQTDNRNLSSGRQVIRLHTWRTKKWQIPTAKAGERCHSRQKMAGNTWVKLGLTQKPININENLCRLPSQVLPECRGASQGKEGWPSGWRHGKVGKSSFSTEELSVSSNLCRRHLPIVPVFQHHASAQTRKVLQTGDAPLVQLSPNLLNNSLQHSWAFKHLWCSCKTLSLRWRLEVLELHIIHQKSEVRWGGYSTKLRLTKASLSGLAQLNTCENNNMSLFQDQENTSRFICRVNDTLIRVSEGENIGWTAPLRFGETETQPLPLAAGSYPLTSAARARGNRTLTVLTTCFT